MPVAEVKACSASQSPRSTPRLDRAGDDKTRQADSVRAVPLVAVQGEETCLPTPAIRWGRPG